MSFNFNNTKQTQLLNTINTDGEAFNLMKIMESYIFEWNRIYVFKSGKWIRVYKTFNPTNKLFCSNFYLIFLLEEKFTKLIFSISKQKRLWDSLRLNQSLPWKETFFDIVAKSCLQLFSNSYRKRCTNHIG